MNSPMRKKSWIPGIIILGIMIAGIAIPDASAVTFDSGSLCSNLTDTKCLGAFAPSVNTTIPLPTDGILDYTTFDIPYGVTVTYLKNAANTPVIIRTTGDVNIKGTINVSGTSATHSGTAGDGNLGDDGQPGLGGPGGFDGGYGGYSALFGGATGTSGGGGKGPGGGGAGSGYGSCWGTSAAGGGGGFGTAGAGNGNNTNCGGQVTIGAGGLSYGNSNLLPLIGGSGGGGGGAGSSYSGAGGGGGGGAIMIASSGTIMMGMDTNDTNNHCWQTINGIYIACDQGGRIFANGGAGGTSSGSGNGGGGGGGSGGAIRLVANTLRLYYNPYLQAVGGGGGGGGVWASEAGGAGIIKLEANTITGWTTGYSSPAYSFGLPGHVLVPNSPTLSIVSVASVTVPSNPTGNADITLPQGTTSATVSLAATNIPRGTTVTVYVVPASGATRSSALSNALDGLDDTATTATATVTLSPGNNVLMAAATYTVTEIIAMNLPTFDNGIRVAKVRVESTMGGESKVTYITANGKEYPADSPHRDAPGKIKNAVEKEKKA